MVKLTINLFFTSLIDKPHGNQECVANVNGKFMNDLGSGTDSTGIVAVEHAGPVSVTLVCTGKNPLAHTSRITLFNDIPRVDIHNFIGTSESTCSRRCYGYTGNIS